jgi:hypothetical protein
MDWKVILLFLSIQVLGSTSCLPGQYLDGATCKGCEQGYSCPGDTQPMTLCPIGKLWKINLKDFILVRVQVLAHRVKFTIQILERTVLQEAT